MTCVCGHVREDHVPMDFSSRQPCAIGNCPCMRFVEVGAAGSPMTLRIFDEALDCEHGVAAGFPCDECVEERHQRQRRGFTYDNRGRARR